MKRPINISILKHFYVLSDTNELGPIIRLDQMSGDFSFKIDNWNKEAKTIQCMCFILSYKKMITYLVDLCLILGLVLIYPIDYNGKAIKLCVMIWIVTSFVCALSDNTFA